jgi:copper chaperone
MNDILKKRTIRVDGMTCGGCEQTIDKGLLGLEGVKTARADRRGTVYVEYDLLKTSLEDIEQKIIEVGYKIPGNIFNNIKRGWIHFTERNEYDNFTSPAKHCCSVDSGGNVTTDYR